jgi:hypothetical protein
MNQRIRELVDQILPNEKEWHKGDPKDWGYFFSGNELEKFAELIVAECILTIQMGITRDGPNTEKYLRSMKHIKQIREHFGVEE